MPRTKTTKAPKRSVKPSKKAPKYHLTFTVNGDVSQHSGDDMHELVKEFTAPEFVKSKFMVMARKGDRVVEELLQANDARRIFRNHSSVALFAHNLTKKLG